MPDFYHALSMLRILLSGTLICKLCSLLLLRLGEVVTLVMAFLKSFENCSVYRHNHWTLLVHDKTAMLMYKTMAKCRSSFA